MEERLDELKLNDACAIQKAHIDAKGFKKENVPTYLMLTVSELSEALEADRKNRHADLKAFKEQLPVLFVCPGCYSQLSVPTEEGIRMFKEAFETHIKDTFEDEIADTFLRLMHLCGEFNIDIETHIRAKMAYNDLRPVRHGKAY